MKSLKKGNSGLTIIKVFIIVFLLLLIACCAGKPTVITNEVTNISKTSAISGGTVTANSRLMVTGRGVCWSLTPKPRIYGSKTNDGQGYGSFTSNLEGLNPNTTYYVRAFATTLKGPVYGEQVSFKTYLYTISDIDGNSYNAIQIGNQVWLAENLKTTKYNDGALIPYIPDDTLWANCRTGAYCWYNNDTTYKNIYGALYNWFTINTGKLCPAGWHVPTDIEWEKLASYLGGDSIAGGKLKEEGSSHWVSPNMATNECSFTSLPGGYRQYYNAGARFSEIKFYGFWWTTLLEWNEYPWYVYMINGDTRIWFNWDGSTKEDGYAVRCLKD